MFRKGLYFIVFIIAPKTTIAPARLSFVLCYMLQDYDYGYGSANNRQRLPDSKISNRSVAWKAGGKCGGYSPAGKRGGGGGSRPPRGGGSFGGFAGRGGYRYNYSHHPQKAHSEIFEYVHSPSIRQSNNRYCTVNSKKNLKTLVGPPLGLINN